MLFLSTVAVGSYWLGFGLKREEKIVLSIGLGTRNIGAALAPLLAMDIEPQATVMVAMAVPLTLLLALVSAKLFAGHGTRGSAIISSAAQRSTLASGHRPGRS